MIFEGSSLEVVVPPLLPLTLHTSLNIYLKLTHLPLTHDVSKTERKKIGRPDEKTHDILSTVCRRANKQHPNDLHDATCGYFAGTLRNRRLAGGF